jgi:hypothetical protein
MMNHGNAFVRRQGGMFIPCEGCTQSQQCGSHGHCYRDMCSAYNQQYGHTQHIGNQMSQPLNFNEGIRALFHDFRRDYNMLRDTDSDGGECD